jgi:type IV pilus assembly protein PilM
MKFRNFLRVLPQKATFDGKLLQKNHLGCLYDRDRLFFSHLHISPSKIAIDCLSCQEVTEHVNPLDILKKKVGAKNIGSACMTTSFPSGQTLVRPLELKSFATEELDAVLKFQLEPLLPYPIDEAISDALHLEKGTESELFTVFSAKKEDLKTHLEEYGKWHIDPEIVAPKALAIAHFADLFLPRLPLRLICDICPDETTCLLLKEGKPFAVRSLPMGLESTDIATQDTHLRTFSRELERILLNLENSGVVIKDVPITFTGTSENDPLILSLLGKLLGHPTEQPESVPPHIELHNGITASECTSFAVPIGLALIQSPFQREKFAINLRKGDLIYPRRWRRWKKDFVLYFTAITLLAALFYFFGARRLAQDTRALQNQYESYVTLFEKTPQDIEELLGKDNPNFAKKEISSLSPHDIEERLSYIDSKLRKPPDEMAFSPNIPRVADLLAWLSSHPNIRTEKGAIALETLSYTLTERPCKEKPKGHYRVRCDLSFAAPSPEAARAFYDSLCAPNPFVDPQQEVKWNVQKGTYSVSFFLQDRTQYP